MEHGVDSAGAGCVRGGVWAMIEGARLRQQVNHLREDRAAQQQRLEELEKEVASEREKSDKLAAELDRLYEQPSPSVAPFPAQPPTPQPERPSAMAFLLPPLLLRSGGEPTQLTIPNGIDAVLLQMKVEEPLAPSYHIGLRTVEGASIWNQAATKARRQPNKGAYVSVRIPAHKLPAGDYLLTLTAADATNKPDEAHRYFFRVVRP
jgi:uncharacterized coiled-coil protein SlyX